jgi:sugar phosphate isomerase/epimerase
MLKFSANLKWLFTELPLLDRFDAAARAGFAAVEYPTPYEQPVATLAARLRDCGLQMVLINTPAGDKARGEQSGIACMPGRRDAFRDDLRKSLDYATGLGCNLVHLQAGILPTGVSAERGWATYLANVVWAADLASTGGIRLVLEPINQIDIPGFLLRTQEEGAAVVEAVGPDKVGLQFDPPDAGADADHRPHSGGRFSWAARAGYGRNRVGAYVRPNRAARLRWMDRLRIHAGRRNHSGARLAQPVRPASRIEPPLRRIP